MCLSFLTPEGSPIYLGQMQKIPNFSKVDTSDPGGPDWPCMEWKGHQANCPLHSTSSSNGYESPDTQEGRAQQQKHPRFPSAQ